MFYGHLKTAIGVNNVHADCGVTFISLKMYTYNVKILLLTIMLHNLLVSLIIVLKGQENIITLELKVYAIESKSC